jgi:hypothetical protein
MNIHLTGNWYDLEENLWRGLCNFSLAFINGNALDFHDLSKAFSPMGMHLNSLYLLLGSSEGSNTPGYSLMQDKLGQFLINTTCSGSRLENF